MAEYEVILVANEGIFRGLAKQNMLFHQCVCELIDNAIAAKREDQKFRIEVILSRRNDDIVDVYVVDDCRGMSLEVFKMALQLGVSATTDNRLNEHGFGMKKKGLPVDAWLHRVVEWMDSMGYLTGTDSN